jgi:predicted transporter
MNPLLIEGLTDAVGFVAGALIGFAIASVLGLDPLAAGYSNSAIGGIVLCGLGGGAGVHIARRWRAGRKDGK